MEPDNPFRTLGDMMAAAKAKPGQVKYGYGGIATNPHLAMSQLVLVANVDLLAVPFRGDPQAILALKAGDVDAATMNIGGAKAQGLRILGTFAEVRQQEIPDVPTMKELGYPVVSSAIRRPVRAEGDIARRRAQGRGRVREGLANDPRYQQKLRELSQEPAYRNGADFAKVLAADLAAKGEVVKRAGIKANANSRSR